jgi:hypothetical protein
MRRSFHAFALVSIAAALVACASAWPAQHAAILPGSSFGDSALDGAYRWTTLDGKPAPVEFPLNSGRRFVYGTLDLSNSAAARTGMAGRYSRRFTVQPANDTVQTVGDGGAFMLMGDTIRFEPNVLYRFSWRPNGDLVLTDGANHAWVYTRR